MSRGTAGDDFFVDGGGQGSDHLPSAVQSQHTESLDPSDLNTRVVEVATEKTDS